MPNPPILPDYTLDDYQRRALDTCKDTCANIDYPTHELLEETCEYYDKFYNDLPDDVRESDIQLRSIHTAAMHLGQLAKSRAKTVRHGEVATVVTDAGTREQRLEKAYELGDQLWGIAVAARQLGFALSQIAALNNEKLARRKAEGKIEGDGDHR